MMTLMPSNAHQISHNLSRLMDPHRVIFIIPEHKILRHLVIPQPMSSILVRIITSASAVEVIESVPSVCVCVLVCVCESVSIMPKGLSAKALCMRGTREVSQRSGVFISKMKTPEHSGTSRVPPLYSHFAQKSF